MAFDHEKLDVYRVSIEFAAWSHRLSRGLKGINRNARDQLLRASFPVPLNIAEGNGRLRGRDRARFLRIACGSALECSATLDVLEACEAISGEQKEQGRILLLRIVAMLNRMTAMCRAQN